MKSFYDETESLVLDALESLVVTQPDLVLDKSKKTIWRKSLPNEHVALLSGGGAGHEPAHAGYVGKGMLTAAVSGSIFASPSVAQITAAIQRITRPAGVLLIIKNYTGDVFHFHLAAEKAKASLGIPVEVLVVGDDVAIGRERSGKVGRRGLAGTVLVHKILGAYSSQPGVTLADVLKLGKEIVQNLVTIGVSLDHVYIPGREKLLSSDEDQVELGMGIHNEPGSQVLSPRPPLPALINTMLDRLLDFNDKDRGYVDFSDAEHVVLLVNNLGGLSPLEFSGITTNIIKQLDERKIRPSSVVSGAYMTSLNGPGFSITLLKANPDILEYIKSPTDAPGWGGSTTIQTPDLAQESQTSQTEPNKSAGLDQASSGVLLTQDVFKAAVTAACNNVISAEPRITEHDSYVGDGDCGVTLARGAKAVLEYIESPNISNDALRTVVNLAEVIENNMDGTSGAIYGIFFAALASAVRTASPGTLGASSWVQVASTALAKLQEATPARQGDRTMMDALEPFVKSLAAGSTLKDAVSAARAGVEATKGMKASLGRAVYVEQEAWNKVPDPGAEGVLCILEGLESSIV